MGLYALADISDKKAMSANDLLAKAVEKMVLFLIMRTAPNQMNADADAILMLRSLEYSEDDEIKLRDQPEKQNVA